MNENKMFQQKSQLQMKFHRSSTRCIIIIIIILLHFIG